jgi:transcriptional regulator with GAF, ATPase, and Fis domain
VPSDHLAVERATTGLGSEESVPSLLSATARELVDLLDVAACTISRVIGDLLVDLVQHRKTGQPARIGHGYLISDYPLTREVLERVEPRTVFVADAHADPAEVRLLREMDFDALLMAALDVDGHVWGLVEVYGDAGRRFEEEDVSVTVEVTRAAAVRLKQLEAQ